MAGIPDEKTISALVNMGSAGAVILVVFMFLFYLRLREKAERASEQTTREFFTNLLTELQSESIKNTNILSGLVQAVTELRKSQVDFHASLAAEIKEHDGVVEKRVDGAVAVISGKLTDLKSEITGKRGSRG